METGGQFRFYVFDDAVDVDGGSLFALTPFAAANGDIERYDCKTKMQTLVRHSVENNIQKIAR